MALKKMQDGRRPRERVSISCRDEGRVKQSFKDSCDIHKIMKRYRDVYGDGVMEQMNRAYANGGIYGDFSNIPDYRTAQDMVLRAEDSFMRLPAHVRDRFQNDPAYFLDFYNDPENKQELIALGLIKAEEVKKENTASQPEELSKDDTPRSG